MPRRKGRTRSSGGFVQLPLEMLNSQAYQKMRFSARAGLPYFMAKVKIPYLDNRNLAFQEEFSLSYTEAGRYGFARATWFKVISALIKHGFLDPVGKGGFKGFGGTGYNYFRLSQRWRQFGKGDFQTIDWQCFIPKPRSRPRPIKEMVRSKNGIPAAPEEPGISNYEPIEGPTE